MFLLCIKEKEDFSITTSIEFSVAFLNSQGHPFQHSPGFGPNICIFLSHTHNYILVLSTRSRIANF